MKRNLDMERVRMLHRKFPMVKQKKRTCPKCKKRRTFMPYVQFEQMGVIFSCSNCGYIGR